MRAMLSRSVGGPETPVLEELADPKPGPGEVLLAVKACGFLDMSPREICARIDAKNLPPMIGFDGVKAKVEDHP